MPLAAAVPNMPQQRSDQHHPQGTPTMMHPAAGPPIVAQSPAYSTQYFTCSPQQFTSQQLMPHYQSQVTICQNNNSTHVFPRSIEVSQKIGMYAFQSLAVSCE